MSDHPLQRHFETLADCLAATTPAAKNEFDAACKALFWFSTLDEIAGLPEREGEHE